MLLNWKEFVNIVGFDLVFYHFSQEFFFKIDEVMFDNKNSFISLLYL